MSWSFSDTAPAQAIVDDIKSGKYTSSNTIYSLLQQIVKDLPGTSVAKEAQAILNEKFY